MARAARRGRVAAHEREELRVVEGRARPAGAARLVGMERTNLHKRIRALGLSRGANP